MKRKYMLYKEPQGELYRDVLTAGLAHASTLGLVFPNSSSTGPSPSADALGPFLLEEEEVSEWPGTLSQELRLRRLYELNVAVVEILSATVMNLFDWQMPDRPEDPHLLRADRSLWLGTISHERDAWLELSDAERTAVEEAHPRLASAIADEEDVRELVARFWDQHLAARFPPGLAGQEIPEGGTLGYLDASAAGCIETFIAGSGPLDRSRLDVLKNCWSDLDDVAGMLQGDGQVYFHRLWRMTDFILALHEVDPLGTPRRRGDA
jgi:hypothetical protein